MRKLLHLTSLLVTAWCLSLAGLQSALASHFQGGQLTYTKVAGVPNRYKFTLRVFRDCGGATLYTTATFAFKSAGCNSASGDPANIVAPLLGGSTIGSPYCAAAPAGPSPCDAGLPTNYETGRYEAEVTLPPKTEWRISVTDNARPETANLTGQNNIYYEATLNNLVGGTLAIENNSAQFDLLNVPVPFVCWKQQTTLNFTATDADGDELVYSLEQPLQNCGDPIPYKSYATSRIIDIGTPTVPCAAVITGTGMGTYTPNFPIASFDITGPACPALRTATPSFVFNASTGSFTFTPYLYDNVTNSALNKYVVTGKVSEYRLINGVRTLVGSVRRDIFVVVIDCSNAVPGNPVATGNNTNSGVTIRNTTDSTFMEVSTCNYTRVLVRFTDPDPNDLLTVTFPPLVATAPGDPTYLNSDVGTFRVVGNGTRRPVGVFDLQPDVLFAGQTFRVPVQIRDNGCPIIGQQTRVIVISVKARNPARVVAAANNTFICSGSAVALTATPTRPDSVLLDIGTPTPNPSLATYTYAWEPANGLATADQNQQNIIVRPTQTTRYRVRITARDFRMVPLPTCVDTTSILVTVRPSPAANLAISGPDRACAAAQATVNFALPGEAGSTYAWTVNGVPQVSPAGTLPVGASVPGTYTITVRETNASVCAGPLYTKTFTVVPPLAITGPTSYCPETRTGLSYTIGTSLTGGVYQWTVTGGTIVGGQNSPTIQVDFPAGAATATIQVSETTSTSCTAAFTVRPDNASTNLVVASVGPRNDRQVVLTLNVPNNTGNTNRVNILRRPAGSTGAFTNVGNVPNTATTFTDTGVDADASAYDYRLDLTNACGTLLSSTQHTTIRTQATAMEGGAGRDEGKATVTWNPYLGFAVREYQVFRTPDNGAETLLQTVSAGTTSLTVATGSAGFNQCFRVQAISATGTPVSSSNEACVDFANDLVFYNVVTPNGDGLNDQFIVKNAELYSGSTLTVFNRWGKEVYKGSNYRNTYDGTNSPAGVYYYQFQLAGGQSYKGWFEVVR